jgi:peptidyl-prolyl cis-trans isomerase A (cyclophilin A)
MKPSSLLRRSALALVFACSSSVALFADEMPAPIVAIPISDFTVSTNSAPTVINLKRTFGLEGVSGKIVRMATSLGNIDIGLAAKEAPNTVANFLAYANNPNVGAGYNQSFIHRTATIANAGVGVIQGGGYTISNDQVVKITENTAVASEASISNTRGTIAMALSTGPDSGTDQWFINTIDNTVLDGSDAGGPFTVFGRVVGGLSVADAIAALQIINAGSPFNELPVLSSYNGTSVQFSDLVYVSSVTNLLLTPKAAGEPAALVLKVKGNTNPDLVTATLDVRKLTLTYAPGKTGTATIRVMAKNPSNKAKVLSTFTVTVQ